MVMAENESLDLDGSYRWRKVFRAVQRGDYLDAVSLLVAESLYKTIRRVQKQIPLDQLLDAAETQPDAVGQIIRQCRGHDFAQLFGEVLEPGIGRKATVRNFIEAILEKFSDQIVCCAVPSGRWPQMHEIMDFMHDVGGRLKPDIERIAEKWSNDPTWMPRMKPTGARVAAADQTRAMLNDSILGLSR